MYPRISDLLLDLFGINFPLPIQSFGFFVALAFLSGSYFLAKELKRKENEGHFNPTINKIFVGEPATILELISSAIIGFLLGYKIILLFMDYDGFVINPQEMILSLKGSLPGGVFGAVLAAYLRYKEKQTEVLKTPKWINHLVSPNQHAGNMVMISAILGLTGAKIFHNLEYLDDFMLDPMGSILSFSGLTYYG